MFLNLILSNRSAHFSGHSNLIYHVLKNTSGQRQLYLLNTLIWQVEMVCPDFFMVT